MQKINDCFNKVKKDCFRFILSQETKKDKFKNKDKMIKSFLIPVSFWIAKKTNKKKPFIIGLAGGQAGALGMTWLSEKGGPWQQQSGCFEQMVQAGDRLWIATPGGGGGGRAEGDD